jgi:hypothetical protein
MELKEKPQPGSVKKCSALACQFLSGSTLYTALACLVQRLLAIITVYGKTPLRS